MAIKKYYVNIGDKYADWIVLKKEQSFRNPSGKMVSKVLCKCKCGKESNVEIWKLINKKIKYCNSCNKIGHIPWNKNTKGLMPTPWNKDKKMSNEEKRERNLKKKPTIQSEEGKISFKEKMSGKNSPFWIKDRTKLQRYGDTQNDRRSYAYHAWRHEVKIRDNFKCKINNPDCKGRLEVHHILSYTNFPELRFDINNGITLCRFHHPRKKEEELKLSPYFKKLINNKNIC